MSARKMTEAEWQRLAWRVFGAIWLLLATDCSRRGSAFADASAGRFMYVVQMLICLFVAAWAWKREIKTPDNAGEP